MLHSFADLINAIASGAVFITLGYMIGNARAKRQTRQQIVDDVSFLIYSRNS